MADPKPLASLSAGLLARKGAARPAMRRQVQLTPDPFIGQDDLGWNDMGYDVDPQPVAAPASRTAHGLSPMASPTEAPAQPVVAPIVPDAPVEPNSEPPAVHRHMQRLEDEVARRVPTPAEVVPVEAAPVEAAPAPAVPAAPESVAPAVLPVVDVPAPVVVEQRKPVARARAGTRGAFAFTLRLDPSRHLRLRLASATSNRSAQQILIALIDDYLSSQPEIDAFAAALPGAPGSK
jgi:hypothetical protein